MSISDFPYATFLGAENRRANKPKPVDMAAFVALKRDSSPPPSGVAPRPEIQGQPTVFVNENLVNVAKSLEEQLRHPTHATIPSKHRRGEVSAPRWQQWTHSGNGRLLVSPSSSVRSQNHSPLTSSFAAGMMMLDPLNYEEFSTGYLDQQPVGSQSFGNFRRLAPSFAPSPNGLTRQQQHLQQLYEGSGLQLDLGPRLFDEDPLLSKWLLDPAHVNERLSLGLASGHKSRDQSVGLSSSGERGGNSGNAQPLVSTPNKTMLSSHPHPATTAPSASSSANQTLDSHQANRSELGFSNDNQPPSMVASSPLSRTWETRRSQSAHGGRLASLDAQTARWKRKDEREVLQQSHAKIIQQRLLLQQQQQQLQMLQEEQSFVSAGTSSTATHENGRGGRRGGGQEAEGLSGSGKANEDEGGAASGGVRARTTTTVASLLVQNSRAAQSPTQNNPVVGSSSNFVDDVAMFGEEDAAMMRRSVQAPPPSSSSSSPPASSERAMRRNETQVTNSREQPSQSLALEMEKRQVAVVSSGSGTAEKKFARSRPLYGAVKSSHGFGTDAPAALVKAARGRHMPTKAMTSSSISSSASTSPLGGDATSDFDFRSGTVTLPQSPPPFYQVVPGEDWSGDSAVDELLARPRPMTHWTTHMDARPSLRHSMKPQTSTYLTLNHKSNQG